MTQAPTLETFSIYGLVHPQDMLFRYIGMTQDALERFKHHLQPSQRRPGTKWIDDLEAQGLTPLLMILETDIMSRQAALIRERYWMRRYTDLGHPLENIGDNRESVLEKQSLALEAQTRIYRGEDQVPNSAGKQGRGPFTQLPTTLWTYPGLSVSERWLAATIMRLCWRPGPQPFSYRQLAKETGLTSGALCSGQSREGMIPHLEREELIKVYRPINEHGSVIKGKPFLIEPTQKLWQLNAQTAYVVSTQHDTVSTHEVYAVGSTAYVVSTQHDTVSTFVDSVSTQHDTVSTFVDSVSTQEGVNIGQEPVEIPPKIIDSIDTIDREESRAREEPPFEPSYSHLQAQAVVAEPLTTGKEASFGAREMSATPRQTDSTHDEAKDTGPLQEVVTTMSEEGITLPSLVKTDEKPESKNAEPHYTRAIPPVLPGLFASGTQFKAPQLRLVPGASKAKEEEEATDPRRLSKREQARLDTQERAAIWTAVEEALRITFPDGVRCLPSNVRGMDNLRHDHYSPDDITRAIGGLEPFHLGNLKANFNLEKLHERLPGMLPATKPHVRDGTKTPSTKAAGPTALMRERAAEAELFTRAAQ